MSGPNPEAHNPNLGQSSPPYYTRQYTSELEKGASFAPKLGEESKKRTSFVPKLGEKLNKWGNYSNNILKTLDPFFEEMNNNLELKKTLTREQIADVLQKTKKRVYEETAENLIQGMEIPKILKLVVGELATHLTNSQRQTEAGGSSSESNSLDSQKPQTPFTEGTTE